MDALKDLKLPAALFLSSLVLGAFGSVVALVIFGHQSLAAVSSFITSLGVAAGAWLVSMQRKSVERVETLANGNLARRDEENARLKDQMMNMQAEHNRVVAQLTAALPPGTPLPSALADGKV